MDENSKFRIAFLEQQIEKLPAKKPEKAKVEKANESKGKNVVVEEVCVLCDVGGTLPKHVQFFHFSKTLLWNMLM